MGEHRISGRDQSVVTFTGSFAAVSDTTLRQTVVFDKSFIKACLVMFSLICTPNTILIHLACFIQFQPAYHREIPTHLNEEFYYRRLQPAPVVTPALFSIFEYITWYPMYFDATHFCIMQTYGNELQVCKCLFKRLNPLLYAGRSSGIFGVLGARLTAVVLVCRLTHFLHGV